MLDLDIWRARQHNGSIAVVTSCCRLFYLCLSMLRTLLFVAVLLPSVALSVVIPSAYASASAAINVRLINGSVSPTEPLLETSVAVQQIDSEGKIHWHSSAVSDSQGYVNLLLPVADSIQGYRLEVASPTNQQLKYSEVYSSAGDFEFVVGNPAVNVTVVDAKTQHAISGQTISAYRLAVDGAKTWFASRESDANGQVVFDLDGIAQGIEYELQSRVYNQFNYITPVINSPQTITMVMGETRIQLFNGSSATNEVYAGAEVTIHQLDELGARHYYGEAVVDSAGWLKLNLANIDLGQSYQLSLYSPVSGQLLYTPVIENSGEHQFTLGNLPLNVRLLDVLTGQTIANGLVEVYRLADNGEYMWFTEKLTNANGQLTFDLPRLGHGQTYRLSTKALGPIPMESSDITTTGDFDFAVGNSELQVFNGSLANTPVFADTNVALYQLVNGEQVWVISGNTDANGKIRFDLASSNQYQFRVNSPVNGKSQFSDVIVATGNHQMTVGNPEVKVRLSNALTAEVYPHQEISAFHYDQAGVRHWYSSQTTDENGIAVFDLDGITQGQSYLFKAAVFDSGSSYSRPISHVQDVDFKVGSVPVTLLDRDSGAALTHKRIAAYLMMDNGALQWLSEGSTNDNGVAMFDFEQFYSHFASRIVLKAIDPFGSNKRYYGPVLTNVGAVEFYVKQGAYGDVDLLPPTVTIDSPNEIANAQGFMLRGRYQDDIGVSKVQVTVVDANKGNHSVEAELVDGQDGDGRWSAFIPESWISVEQQVFVVVTASDYGLNQGATRKRFMVTQDVAPPSIMISSHQQGDSVNVIGFTLKGRVSDDIGVNSIHASLLDPVLGTTIFEQPLYFSEVDGQWVFTVTNGKVSPDQLVTVRLVASDINQKQTELTLGLNTLAVQSDPLHLASRITFGLTPQLLARLKTGVDYLEEQLNPAQIDDSAFEAQMAQLPVTNKAELKQYSLHYMAGSQKQLREVMTWFWENHFNTDINTHGQVSYEFLEHQAFRRLALGKFRDLLAVSAKSPAMIRYLNNQQNVAGRANENYAREIMELHTLGVDGGYTATDIAELSKIFTGWHEQDGVFSFNDGLHDTSDKQFLGYHIIGDGVNEGEQVLDILAAHPATASYICGKLVTVFVSDIEVPSLQNQCAAEFLTTQGDIKAVLALILNSSEFVASDNQANKVKTPLELVLTIIRGYSEQFDAIKVDQQIADMGMRLFEFPVPTGFSEHGADWLNTQAVLKRIRLAIQAVSNPESGFTVDFKSLLLSQGLNSADGIVSYLFELALANQFTELERQMALDILHQSSAFNIDANDASDKLNRLLGTVLSFPAAQYQ